jgi:hypothetical protein
MHWYSAQALAAQRVRDLREQGAAARRATEARRARRGHGLLAAGWVPTRRPGAPRWA